MDQNSSHRIFHSVSRDNNMNAVRYYLVLCILTNHFATLSDSIVPALPRIFGGAGSFFALSGFLMFSSFEKRHNVKRYFERRARRIFPPYFLVVLLAAIGFASISSLPLSDYFTNSGFWKYLAANLTFMNFAYPSLPGVFESSTNYISAVNGSLWTMKGEIVCYLSVPVVYYFIKKTPSRAAMILVGLIVLMGVCYLACDSYSRITGHDITIITKQFCVFMIFYAGAFINLKFPLFLKYKWIILSICGLLILAEYFGAFLMIDGIDYLYYVVISPFVTSMMVLICSFVGKWGAFLSHHDAISYDIYLVHFPVIQTIIYFGAIDILGYFNALLLTIAIVVLLAFMSWKFVGKKVLDGGSKVLK